MDIIIIHSFIHSHNNNNKTSKPSSSSYPSFVLGFRFSIQFIHPSTHTHKNNLYMLLLKLTFLYSHFDDNYTYIVFSALFWYTHSLTQTHSFWFLIKSIQLEVIVIRLCLLLFGLVICLAFFFRFFLFWSSLLLS